ncbi:acetylglutamate kinase [Thermoflavimicrobium daqui]|uniref:Acetylglutamate kinase n=1 Tax=Thermoflavimicrobium daqui TaxID=2137476 RepID=A0A364K100_9BACL|nr:acetylglutamate kinase [Thermoflavimicrobium daqui]
MIPLKAVIKIGGSVLANLPSTFFMECLKLKEQGVTSIIVHGGGPMISKWMDQMGMKPRFIEGRRVTDEQTLQIVEMVLAGTVNKQLVSQFREVGVQAIGMSGIDLGLIQVSPLDGELGYVGQISTVNDRVIETMIAQGWIPIIASIGVDQQGQHYNINADDAASAIAQAVQAKKLISVSNVDGVQIQHRTIKQMTAEEVEKYIQNGEISGGMIPKVRSGVQSLKGCVHEVVIVNGQKLGCLTNENHGTRLIKGEMESHVLVSHL